MARLGWPSHPMSKGGDQLLSISKFVKIYGDNFKNLRQKIHLFNFQSNWTEMDNGWNIMKFFETLIECKGVL
jgi:hypothetical protein